MEGGRGRGLALLQNLKKQSSPDASQTPSEVPSPAPSEIGSNVPSSVVSAPLPGGRGRALALLKAAQRPGGPPSAVTSEQAQGSGESSGAPQISMPPRGGGRGLSLINILKPSQSATTPPVLDVAEDVYSVTSQLQSTVISESSTTTLKSKNKYVRTVKDTPPVVKRGTFGKPIDITANFIRLEVEPGKGVFEYEVRYDPFQDMKGHRIKLLNAHLDIIGKTKTFDGTTLYLPIELGQEVTELVSQHPTDGYPVKVKIIFRRQRRMGEVVHLYNVLFKNIMRELQMIRFGRQHYDPALAVNIPQHKLEVWPGYVSAVDEYEGGLMLSLDSTHRVLRTQSVLSMIREVVTRDKAHWLENLTQALMGCSVMTTYTKQLYRVDDIDTSKNPLSKFTQSDGSEISFYDYYKKNYNVEIVDLDQPMLVSRKKRSIRNKDGTEEQRDFLVNLVPELCQMTGLTDDQRSNFRLMKDVATYTRITPNQRMHAFKKFLNNVNSNETCRNLLANWGLKIAPDTIPLQGRVLPPESIEFGRGKVVPGSQNAEWNREVARSHVMEAKDIMNWVLIYTRKDQNCANDFVETMKHCGPPMGITVRPPKMMMLQTDSNPAYSQMLNSVINDQLQLVVVICPTARDDRYAVIKRICNVSKPIPSQVINARTLMNRDKMRAVVQKIALQINCKLGGTLWGISIPFKTAMIIGIDSYHETVRKHHSYCGFVASFNSACTHWYSRVVCQQPGQEIVDGLKSCLTDAIRYFRSVNNAFPDKIIIYRDGVGDGQLNEVREFEIPQFESCFRVVEKNYEPTLTFVVVQKRINTRVFMKLNAGVCENPPPGTVCDYDITRRDWYDFLIVPQKVGQGTVTPSHYIVLKDTSTMTPDQVQRLTYKMCHLYYNWPGTVRVPAPCQYAHKLAFLVGQSMKMHHHMALSDKLFFL